MRLLNRISHHDTHTHDHSWIDPGTPYPKMEDVVRRVKSTDHHKKSLPDLHNQDALFALAIRAHFDQVERVQGYDRQNKALKRILSMGICDWDAQEKNGMAFKGFLPMRYSAVLRNELFKIIEYEELWVSLSIVSRLLVVKTNKGFS